MGDPDRRRQSAGPIRWLGAGTIVLLLALGGGIFLRFSGIGKYGFWTDELFHVFAASSYLEDGTFHVPWDPNEYVRARPITLLTAMSFRLFGQSEASARAVFALANVIFIIIAYRILKGLFTRNVALIFVIATSYSIFSIQMSQECRMYTLFQLFYFLMSIAFFRGLEPARPALPAPGPGFISRIQSRIDVSLKYLLMAAPLGLAAITLQNLTFNFVLVLIAYCITMMIRHARREGFRSTLQPKYALVTMLIVLGTLVLALAKSRIIMDLASLAVQTPAWNRWSESHISFYTRVLIESHPILWAVYPLGAFLAIQRYGRLGLFFVLSFIILFVMHCFVFGRVSERYIFYILPFFITVAAIGVDFVFHSLLGVVRAHALSLTRSGRALLYIAASLSLALVIYPRIRKTVLDTSVPHFSSWKDLDPGMIRAVTDGPSVTTDRLRFNYYFGQYPDHVIDSSDVDHVGGERVIATLADFERVLARDPDLHLVTYNQHLYHDAFVGPEIREAILGRLERVDHEPDARIMVFRGRAERSGPNGIR